jgi:hypothetical protein
MNGADQTTPVQRVLAVLTAVAGLGALVAFTGGAIVWMRFEQAELPGEQAVAVTPQQTLITVGGAAIGAFALIAGLVVLIAYLVDSQGTHTRQAATVLALAGTGVALATLFPDASTRTHVIALAVTAVATLSAIALVAVLLRTPNHRKVRKYGLVLVAAGVAAALVAAAVLWLALDEWLAAGALAAVAVLLGGLAALALLDIEKTNRSWLKKLIAGAGDGIRFLAAPAALAALAGVLWLILNEWWIALLVVIAAALVITVLRVAHNTGSRFSWFGTAIFVAVLVFGAALHALRTQDVPRLQPMAILFTEKAGGGGQSGLFVAQTSDRVYYGLVERCHRDPRDLVLRPGDPKRGTGQIVSVPRSQIAGDAIGTTGTVEDALRRGPQLVGQLGQRFAPDSGKLRELPTQPCADEGVIDQKVRSSTPVPADLAATLATRFRPVLMFDSQERWRPLTIDRLLLEPGRDGPVHRFCDGVKEDAVHCSAILAPGQVGAQPNDPKAYVNFDGVAFGGAEHRTPALASCPEQPQQDPALLDCDRGPASAIYYRAVEANDRYYLDYWWFLRYNRFGKGVASELCRSLLTRSKNCFDHEGDWEGVTVVATKKRPDTLAFVDYAAHEGVFRYTPTQIDAVGERPVIYVARGSHAAYPAACAQDCSQVAELFGHALPEDNTDGLASWGRNRDSECREGPTPCLLPLPETSWGAFAGYWGSRTCREKSGSCRFGVPPRSPAFQRRYRAPWCYSGAGLRLACDGRPPEG